MSGRKSGDLADTGKAESFIEGGGSGIECVDIESDAAAFPGDPLGFSDQPAPPAAVALRPVDPKMANVKPAPVRYAVQPGEESSLRIARDDAEGRFSAWSEPNRYLFAEPRRNLGRLGRLDRKDALLNFLVFDHDRVVRRVLVLLFWTCVACAATARGEDGSCAPVDIAPGTAPTGARVRDYAPIFDLCANGGETRLAIRRMSVDGTPLILTVDPQSLQTSLERASCWRCQETSDAEQRETRYIKALRPPQDPSRPPALVNAGLIHGDGDGAFVTGDLCPSHKPLDRAFFDKLATQGRRTPVALAVSGAWLANHQADFDWLREKERNGALAITWANHSYSHPYVRRLADSRNYFMRPGVDVDREIFETERLIIAEGETPSVFFRFPGLVADAALLEHVRSRHLIALGADGWLALGLRPRPGSIVLVHPNGNEPVGLKIFSRLIDAGAIPLPLRPINEAP